MYFLGKIDLQTIFYYKILINNILKINVENFKKKAVKIRCNSKKALLLLHEVEELLQALSRNNLLTLETLLTKETLKNQN
jgi:hypothetical protein